MFDVSLDIDAHVASMSRSRERAISGVTSGRIGLGQTVTWRARHFGIWFTMTSKITDLDRPTASSMNRSTDPSRAFRHEHLFEDTPLGCRMNDSITIASPIFGVLAERLVLVPYLRRLIRQRNLTLVRSVD